MDPKIQKLIAMSLFFVIVVGIAGTIFLQSNDNPVDSLPYIDEASDFTLPDHTGENFTLSDTDGEVRVLTFIYTKCPDGCAIISSKMAELRGQLQDEGLYQKVQMVTIDFDYQFDNRTDLSNYAQNFLENGDDWKFLLGDKNQTDKVTEDYNFPFYLPEEFNSTDHDNSTDHTDTNSTENHDHVTYVHPFVVYFIDGDRNIRSMKGGLNWTIEEAFNIVDFLINGDSSFF